MDKRGFKNGFIYSQFSNSSVSGGKDGLKRFTGFNHFVCC